MYVTNNIILHICQNSKPVIFFFMFSLWHIFPNTQIFKKKNVYTDKQYMFGFYAAIKGCNISLWNSFWKDTVLFWRKCSKLYRKSMCGNLFFISMICFVRIQAYLQTLINSNDVFQIFGSFSRFHWCWHSYCVCKHWQTEHKCILMY